MPPLCWGVEQYVTLSLYKEWKPDLSWRDLAELYYKANGPAEDVLDKLSAAWSKLKNKPPAFRAEVQRRVNELPRA